MKRARDAPPQRVVIDCGGTKVTTMASTIQRSSYLAGMIDLDQELSEIFVDRDPDLFKTLLRLLRQYPHISGLLPRDELECASLLTEADFFGFEGLLNHVKVRAYYNLHDAEDDFGNFDPPRRLDGESPADFHQRRRVALAAHEKHCKDMKAKFETKDAEHALKQFVEKYGSIAEALDSGILPKHYLQPRVPDPLPQKKIIQVMMPDQPTWFMVGDMYDSKYGGPGDEDDRCPEMLPMARVIEQPGLVRRVVGHALVEGARAERWMEPLVLVAAADQQEWLNCQPKDDAIYLNATENEGDLTAQTGGAARRLLLASDWLEHAVYKGNVGRVRIRSGPFTRLSKGRVWTHVLVRSDPPHEYGFS